MQRFRKNPASYQQYKAVIDEQLAKGIIEEAPGKLGQPVHYLPHQMISRPDKETTELRVVVDASEETRVRKSLTEALHQGPVILPDLRGALLIFRVARYIMTADVEKAYLQLELNDEDRDVT